jgi:transposase-like protein
MKYSGTFLHSLFQLGLQRVQLITSSDYAGLNVVRINVFGDIPWQRCHFHLQQNPSEHMPCQGMQVEVAADLRWSLKFPPFRS